MTERCVYNSRKLFGFIILDLCVNVHRNFVVLVTRKVLNSFGIDRGIYQIGDICVAKLMRGNLEVQTIHHIAVVSGLFSENWSDRLGDLLTIDVAYRPPDTTHPQFPRQSAMLCVAAIDMPRHDCI